MKQSRLFSLVTLVLIAALSLCAQTQPQASTRDQPMDSRLANDRRYALDLYNDAEKRLESIPWLEKVAAALPLDGDIQEALGIALYVKAATISTPQERKSLRLRAIGILNHAKELGDSSNLLQLFLAAVPANGEDPTASENPEIDKALKDGEADFAAGKFDEAKRHYLQVLLIEPKNYLAQLFMGDMYFAQEKYSAANEWFARAAESDPNIELAFRYWGDSLMRQNDHAAAREKFISAIVAEPYTRQTWGAAKQWADTLGLQLVFPQISPAANVLNNGKPEIQLDKQRIGKDNTVVWLAYGLAKKMWLDDGFKAAFPGQPYRHSLAEETRALTGAALVAIEQQKSAKNVDFEKDIQILLRLHNAGLVEPFVLLNAADEDITRDYEQFRNAHRDILIRYLNEIVFPPVPKEQRSN